MTALGRLQALGYAARKLPSGEFDFSDRPLTEKGAEYLHPAKTGHTEQSSLAPKSRRLGLAKGFRPRFGAGLARGSQDHAPLAHGEDANPAVNDERRTA